MSAPNRMWAIFVEGQRGFWMYPQTVRRTRSEAISIWKSFWREGLQDKMWRNWKLTRNIKAERVIVIEEDDYDALQVRVEELEAELKEANLMLCDAYGAEVEGSALFQDRLQALLPTTEGE